MAGSETNKVGEESQVPSFNNMLVVGDQPWLNLKPLSLLKLFFFRCISIASFTSWSKYPDILFNAEVPMKSMR